MSANDTEQKTAFKHTKILATVGPSVFAEAKLEAMVKEGVNGFRLNFSHGSYEERDDQIRLIRKHAKLQKKTVAIVQDLQGPKIRFGVIKDNRLEMRAGEEYVLDYAVKEHKGGKRLPVQYNLAEKVRPGEPISFFDGTVRAEITAVKSKTAIQVRILNDGFIMSHKGINLPETDLGGDIITDKDLADLEFGASRDFDYVAMSFVQSREDIEKLRQLLVSYGSHAKIIAKIETKKAISSDERMEEIVESADGIMIARGDMAIEAGAEIVPVIERKLIMLCQKHAKMSIVATQMMASMVSRPEPTRAEVSDVATAVFLGADCVMLSDETATGAYPIETVRAMRDVILLTEEHRELFHSAERREKADGYDAIADAAVALAEKIHADVILAATKTGATAWALAGRRSSVPMITVTSDHRVAGQLALVYGNEAYTREYNDNYAVDLLQDLKAEGRFGAGELKAVSVSGLFDVHGGTNTIQIKRV